MSFKSGINGIEANASANTLNNSKNAVFLWYTSGHDNTSTEVVCRVIGIPHTLTNADETTVKPYMFRVADVVRTNIDEHNNVKVIQSEEQFAHPRRIGVSSFNYCITVVKGDNNELTVINCNKHTNLDRRCDAMIEDIWSAFSMIECLYPHVEKKNAEGETPLPPEDDGIIWIEDNCKNPTVEATCKCDYCGRTFGTRTTKKRYNDYYYNRMNVRGFVQDVSAIIEAAREHGIYWCDECIEKEENQ